MIQPKINRIAGRFPFSDPLMIDPTVTFNGPSENIPEQWLPLCGWSQDGATTHAAAAVAYSDYTQHQFFPPSAGVAIMPCN